MNVKYVIGHLKGKTIWSRTCAHIEIGKPQQMKIFDRLKDKLNNS